METRNSPFYNNEDRISKLPETLIHHILSFLDMKYVVQTSVLSSTWRYFCNSLPILNFNSYQFYSPETLRFDGFIDFVDRVLILRDNSDIQRFDLVWHEIDSNILTSRLNTWILAALRRNVQELSIDILVNQFFQFPSCLFTCNSLTKLELGMSGTFESEIILPNSMGLPRLKFLKLRSLSIQNEKLTEKLFSSCPVLESLIITDSYLADTDMNLNISSGKLKHFTLDNHGYVSSLGSRFKIVKLNVPNLISFNCKDYMSQDYSLGNLSSLVTADINMVVEEDERDENPENYSYISAGEKELYALRMMKFLRALHNVKDLTLSPGFLEVVLGAPDLLDRRPPQFCNLRCLKLQTWVSRNCMHAISYLLKISPNIESLFLRISETKLNAANLGDNWEAGLSFPCMLYHLKLVEIRGVLGSVNELKFLESLLKNAIVLEKVVLFSYKPDSPDRVRQLMMFREKLRTFPSASSRIAIYFFQS